MRGKMTFLELKVDMFLKEILNEKVNFRLNQY